MEKSEDSISIANVCSQPERALKEVFLKDLKVGQVASDSILWAKVITEPVQVAGVILIIEDGYKDVISLGLYNQVRKKNAVELNKLFPVGMVLGVKHPYLSLSYTGVLSLRNDNPENIMFKIE